MKRYRIAAVMRQTVWMDVDAHDADEAEQRAQRALQEPHRCNWDDESEHSFDEIVAVDEIEIPRTVRS